MDRATRITRYRESSIAADDLAMTGKLDQTVKLLQKIKEEAEAAGDEDYALLAQAELLDYTTQDYPAQISLLEKAIEFVNANEEQQDYFILRAKGDYHSKMEDQDGALELYDAALAIKPEDAQSLVSKGISLSKVNDDKGAAELADRALTFDPDNVRALQLKAVSLSKIGEEEDALNLFDRAIAIQPDNYHTLRYKAVCLSRMGKEDEAFEFFEKATDIKPDDAVSVRSWAISAYNLQKVDLALTKIKEAVKLDVKYKDDFFALMRFCGKQPEQEWLALFPGTQEVPTDSDRIQDIRDFVGIIRKNLGDKAQDFLDQKEEAESNVKMFLHPVSQLAQDKSFFLVLRKWNSYTPAIPSDKDERSLGGGYFIYHKGKGTVIDPGYNFIENFYNAGCRIRDIDNIVITHAHNDHTIDFESICTLLYKYNDDMQKPQRPKKSINLYFNIGSFKKFSGLLNLKDKNFDSIRILNIGNKYELCEGMDLTVLPAYHDEVVSRDGSVGLLFTLSCGEGTRKIVFTSDTGLFPLRQDSDKPKPDTAGKELWERYPLSAIDKVDLLVVHIGSIKDEEFNVDLHKEIANCLYPNHLGMIGTARMITKLKPDLALVSEFGEEMRNFRRDIVERIEQDVVHNVVTTELKPRVVPADLAFIYDIAQTKFLCCSDYSWKEVSTITCDYENSSKESLYFFSKENLKKIGRSDYADKITAFRRRLATRDGMYFFRQENGE